MTLLFAGVEFVTGDIGGAVLRLIVVLIVVPLLAIAVFKVFGYPNWWPES